MKATLRLAAYLGSRNKDYQEGLKLYKELAVNPDRNVFLTTVVPSNVHVNMLNNDLQRYARIHNVKPINQKEAQKIFKAEQEAFQKIIQQQNPKKVNSSKKVKHSAEEDIIENGRNRIIKNQNFNYTDLPEDLKSVYDQFEHLYSEYDGKRVQLVDLGDAPDKNAERKQLAGEILALYETIRCNWDAIDQWIAKSETGKSSEENLQPNKPSGSLTKAQIEEIQDPEIKALSKQLRIEANLKYIQRNAGIAKKGDKVKERLVELNEWGVNYASVVKKDSASDSSV